MRYGLTQLLLNTDGVAPVSGDQHYHYGDNHYDFGDRADGDRADGDHHYDYGDRADDDHHYVDDDADEEYGELTMQTKDGQVSLAGSCRYYYDDKNYDDKDDDDQNDDDLAKG